MGHTAAAIRRGRRKTREKYGADAGDRRGRKAAEGWGRVKKSELFLPRAFFGIPIWLSIVPSHVLSPGAKLLWCAIADHLGRNDEVWPGRATLATMTGLNLDRISSDLSKLHRVGMLEVRRTARGNRYTLTAPSALLKLAAKIGESDGEIDPKRCQETLTSWMAEIGVKRCQGTLTSRCQETLTSAMSGNPDDRCQGTLTPRCQGTLTCTSKDEPIHRTNPENQPSLPPSSAVVDGKNETTVGKTDLFENTTSAQAPSPSPHSAAPPSKPANGHARPADPLWDAVAAIWFGGSVAKPDASRVGRIVQSLRQHGATADDIRDRIARYRQTWPKAEATPEAILKHWARFAPAAKSKLDPDQEARFRRERAGEANAIMQRERPEYVEWLKHNPKLETSK